MFGWIYWKLDQQILPALFNGPFLQRRQPFLICQPASLGNLVARDCQDDGCSNRTKDIEHSEMRRHQKVAFAPSHTMRPGIQGWVAVAVRLPVSLKAFCTFISRSREPYLDS